MRGEYSFTPVFYVAPWGSLTRKPPLEITPAIYIFPTLSSAETVQVTATIPRSTEEKQLSMLAWEWEG